MAKHPPLTAELLKERHRQNPQDTLLHKILMKKEKRNILEKIVRETTKHLPFKKTK